MRKWFVATVKGHAKKHEVHVGETVDGTDRWLILVDGVDFVGETFPTRADCIKQIRQRFADPHWDLQWDGLERRATKIEDLCIAANDAWRSEQWQRLDQLEYELADLIGVPKLWVVQLWARYP